MDKDSATKWFMEQNDVFADAVNYLIYGGKEVVKPENLKTKDVTELSIPFGKNGKATTNQKVRDVLKLCALKETSDVAYFMIGIENQSELHYAMPVRNMLYDALNYASQVEKISKKHKDNKDKMDTAEFLSGLKKDDRLIPVITIVVYWNTNDWEGPRNLMEMLDIGDKSIIPYINDYKVNLLVPSEIKDFKPFKSHFGQIMNFIKCSKDTNELKTLLETQHKFFSNIKRQEALVLELSTGAKFTNATTSRGGVNMCKAFEQMKDEGRREGLETGRREGLHIGLAEGLQTGRAEGLTEGEDKLTSLLCLLSDEDLQRFKTSKGSKEIREELYKKYGIE